MNSFDYHQPSTLDEAIELLVRYGDTARILAGGTALYVDMERGQDQPAHVIGLEKVPDLGTIYENGGLHIGAYASLTDIKHFAGTRPDLQAMVDSILLFGGRQIQNVATAGGNICKASPGADMVPPLLCLDAQIRLRGPDGERMVPLDGFITGPNRTAIRPAEILTEIILPPVPSNTGTAFQKKMRRQAEDISIVAVAARVSFAADQQTCEDVRIALCAVAPTPFRARTAEEALTGAALDSDSVRRAAQAASDESRPIDDVRASADYRHLLIETLTERALHNAAERALSGERVS